MMEPDGRVATWNEGAERIKGYKGEEIVGKHFSCFYEEQDVEAGLLEAELREAAEKGAAKLKAGGYERQSRFWADVVITAIKDQAGTLIGFAKVTRDMTNRKEADDRLQHLMQQREDFVAL